MWSIFPTDLAIKRFLKAVVDNPNSALAAEAKIVDLFSEPRVMRASHEIAGLDYIQADPDYQRMTVSRQTGDNGAFDPLILAADPANIRSRLTVVEAAKILFASGEIVANARVSGGYEFQPATLGGFQVGEADRPGGGWDSQTVPIDPSSDTLLPLREGTSSLPETLPQEERVRLFVASLRGDSRLREDVVRGLTNLSALAVAGERLYLADSGSGRIVSYAVGENDGRLSDSRDEIVGVTNPSALAVSASGRLYFADSGSARIASYAIGVDGQLLTLEASNEIILAGNPRRIIGDFAASDERIYVTYTAVDINTFQSEHFIHPFKIGVNGLLSSEDAQESAIDFVPRSFVAISGERLFVATNEQIASYAIGEDGALSANPLIISIPDNPSALLAANGRLYVADDTADKIVSYAIEVDGRLSNPRDEVVENLDEPAAIEATDGRIYIADRGVVDKIVSYDIGRQFEPFVYPRFLHGDEDKRATGARRELHSRGRRGQSDDDGVGGNRRRTDFLSRCKKAFTTRTRYR